MITGRIKQIETMGLVDGPGVRIVIFMQGCTLRCLFCHNPEMWSFDGGITITPEEILNTVLKYKNYFGEEGGVTFSGGEPLSQPKFLIQCLKLCKEHDINTCIDTAGVGDSAYYEEILKYTDLVLFSIKGLTEVDYKKISKGSMSKSLEFLNTCQKLNKKMWIRSVIIPSINDTDEYIEGLAYFIKPLSNIEKVELLPYHTMGVSKYKELGIDYSLIDTKAMNIEKVKALQEKLNKLLNL
jgi:pyruvate formate lyase activating enzyme